MVSIPATLTWFSLLVEAVTGVCPLRMLQLLGGTGES